MSMIRLQSRVSRYLKRGIQVEVGFVDAGKVCRMKRDKYTSSVLLARSPLAFNEEL